MTDIATETTTSGDGSERMDPNLWDGLQNHIDLAMIYAKLPIGDFFRLRQVCKEWNQLASDRKFLEESFRDTIPKPYFVVHTPKMKHHRLLTYEASSRRWNWTPLPRVSCEVAGLLCDYDSNRVFNLHTRMFHALPQAPELPRDPEGEEEEEDFDDIPLMGMTVGTSVSPYSFRVIQGEDYGGTRIYDSKSDSWMHTESTPHIYDCGDHYLPDPTCAQCNGYVYITAWNNGLFGKVLDVYAYNLEKNEWEWYVFTLPDELRYVTYDIGAWQDRLFFLGLNTGTEPCSVAAWECSNPNSKDWAVFDCMPKDLCSWMLAGEEYDDFDDHEVIQQLRTRFCGEYVLVYKWVGREEVLEIRAVLDYMDEKTWGKVELV